MGVQTVIDGFDFTVPGFSHMFDSLGGTDYLGIRPTDSQKAGYYTAMALTFLSPGGAEVGAEKLAQKGIYSFVNKIRNNILVTRAAQKAEMAIGKSGAAAGRAKHTYAINLLKRYESIYGSRGLSYNHYFDGKAGKGFLDVYDEANGVIYDFKFGKALMDKAQYEKYINSFYGAIIYIVRP